jgi:hypothetical protein
MTLYARALAKQYGPKGLRAFSLHVGMSIDGHVPD